jgi:AcrR family transcriptional regulator
MAELTQRKTRARSPQDREAMRGRLCDAAAKLFLEQGAAAFSMRTLAASVGCSPMAPYRYFDTKQDLLAAIRTAAYDRLSDALEATAEGDRRRARDIGEAYVRFALENPEAYKLMFDLAQPGEERFPDLARATERARWHMNRYVRELVDAGVLAGDPVVLGYVFWAAIHGLIILQLAGRLPADPGFEAIRRTALGALMRGLRAEAPTPPVS